MDPNALLTRIGAARPPVDTGLAAGLLKPVIEEGKPVVHLPAAALIDPTVSESLGKMDAFLPAMGLATMKAPDGGLFVFDPRKADPKDLAAGKIVSSSPAANTPATPAAPQPALVAGGNPTVAGGSVKVNQERSMSMQNPSPAEGKGMLGVITKRAF